MLGGKYVLIDQPMSFRQKRPKTRFILTPEALAEGGSMERVVLVAVS